MPRALGTDRDSRRRPPPALLDLARLVRGDADLSEVLAERYLAGLADHSLDPASFLIELTESAWTVDAEQTLAVVADLHASGETFAIDDFGAGYSSRSRLRDLAFDVIKIDRCLLSDGPGDPTEPAPRLSWGDRRAGPGVRGGGHRREGGERRAAHVPVREWDRPRAGVPVRPPVPGPRDDRAARAPDCA